MSADETGPARTIDVRSVEEPPFEAIAAALDDLDPGETVEVVAAAIPLGFLDALEHRGWPYEAVRVVPGEWCVRVAPAADDDTSGPGRCREEQHRRPASERRTLSTQL